MKLPDDFPVKRVAIFAWPWWVLFVFCLYEVWHGFFSSAFIRLVEWALFLAPITYIYTKKFANWKNYNDDEKNHLLKITGPFAGAYYTKEENRELFGPVVWGILVFILFRFLNVP